MRRQNELNEVNPGTVAINQKFIFLRHCAIQLDNPIDFGALKKELEHMGNHINTNEVNQVANGAMEFFKSVSDSLANPANVKINSWNNLYTSHLSINSSDVLVSYYHEKMLVKTIDDKEHHISAQFSENGMLIRWWNGKRGLKFSGEGKFEGQF